MNKNSALKSVLRVLFYIHTNIISLQFVKLKCVKIIGTKQEMSGNALQLFGGNTILRYVKLV